MTNGWANPPGRPTPQKKKTSTVTIVLAILGGGALLAVLVLGIVVYFVMSSEKGRAIVGMVGEGVTITANAQKAPGTKELRAMGCTQALVMNMADLEHLASFLDAGTSARRGPDRYGEMVVCNVGSTPLTCDRVAATYVGVVGTRPEPFMVNVQQGGNHGPLCSSLYDGQSNLMKSMTNGVVPLPSPGAPAE